MAALGCPQSHVVGGGLAGAVDGEVAGFSIDVGDAIVFRQDMGGREVMLLVLTDIEDACRAYTEGALHIEIFEPSLYRRGAGLLAWTVFSGKADGGRITTGPVGLGVPAFEGPSPLPPRGDGAFGFPILARSGQDCSSRPVRMPLEKVKAELRLASVAPAGAVTGTLSLALGGERLAGSFKARTCPLPADFRPPARPACAAAKKGLGQLTRAQADALSRFAPNGKRGSRAGACWQVHLACRIVNDNPALVYRLEILAMESVNREPTGAHPFPPPAAASQVWGPQKEDVYRYSFQNSEGVLPVVERVARGGTEYLIYRADGADSYEVDLTPTKDHLYRLTHRSGTQRNRYLCLAPPQRGPGAKRWTYETEPGDCAPR